MSKASALLNLLTQDIAPEDVVGLMNLPPSKWRRLIQSPSFRKLLRMYAEAHDLMLDARKTAEVQFVFDKLVELARQGGGETARKACMSLLREAGQLRAPWLQQSYDGREESPAADAPAAGGGSGRRRRGGTKKPRDGRHGAPGRARKKAGKSAHRPGPGPGPFRDAIEGVQEAGALVEEHKRRKAAEAEQPPDDCQVIHPVFDPALRPAGEAPEDAGAGGGDSDEPDLLTAMREEQKREYFRGITLGARRDNAANEAR